MAHFAEINENNIVTRVVVVDNKELIDTGSESESETKGIFFCQSLFGGNWIQTSYNGGFRKNYAGLGFYYDSSLDAFIPPKPFDSWLLDDQTCQWYPPVPRPNGPNWLWNEKDQVWIPAS
jgi:hypothetical protein